MTCRGCVVRLSSVVVICSVACRLQEILSVVVGSLLVAGMLYVNMSKIKGTSVLYWRRAS